MIDKKSQVSLNEGSITSQLDNVDDFEREPVPASRTKGFKDFLALVAGEHIAGTEFVIGPLFVLHGVSATAVIFGLLIGNILAVLSWTLFCAPLAVKTRLTLFYLLEKIAGRKLVSLFNAISGLQSTVFAAFMAIVAAGGIVLMTGLPNQSFTQMQPSHFSWMLLIIVLMALITFISISGIDWVTQFARVTTPWLPWIFLASGIAVLPQLGVHSLSDFWQVANTKIWTGMPAAGMKHFNIWHIIFFSWLANTALHIGLQDTFIYRYAKRSWYGIASFGGMFIGHFMAWIASGILCAAAIQVGIGDPTPAQVAMIGAGIAGGICVIIAGWTTANPSLYRAGLAVQGIFPNVKRWKITLLLGIGAMILGFFPGVVSRLDSFLAVFALIAAPAGAVAFMDVYVFPKLGMQQNYSYNNNGKTNWAAGGSWVISIALSYLLFVWLELDFFFFMAIPGWIIAAISYVLLSKVMQGKNEQAEILIRVR